MHKLLLLFLTKLFLKNFSSKLYFCFKFNIFSSMHSFIEDTNELFLICANFFLIDNNDKESFLFFPSFIFILSFLIDFTSLSWNISSSKFDKLSSTSKSDIDSEKEENDISSSITLLVSISSAFVELWTLLFSFNFKKVGFIIF